MRKGTILAQIGDYELVYCFESTVNELHVALCFASLTAFFAEIRTLAQSTILHSVHICVVCMFLPVVTLYTQRKLYLVVLCTSTDDELSVELGCTSLAAPVPEIHSLKIRNYGRCAFTKLACFTRSDTLYIAQKGTFLKSAHNL